LCVSVRLLQIVGTLFFVLSVYGVAFVYVQAFIFTSFMYIALHMSQSSWPPGKFAKRTRGPVDADVAVDDGVADGTGVVGVGGSDDTDTCCRLLLLKLLFLAAAASVLGVLVDRFESSPRSSRTNCILEKTIFQVTSHPMNTTQATTMMPVTSTPSTRAVSQRLSVNDAWATTMIA